jgi:hypothetical protein
MPSVHHQMNFNVPTAEKRRFQPAHLGASEGNQAAVGICPAGGSDEHSRCKISPKKTDILKIVRGFPRLPQANDVTGV